MDSIYESQSHNYLERGKHCASVYMMEKKKAEVDAEERQPYFLSIFSCLLSNSELYHFIKEKLLFLATTCVEITFKVQAN